MNPFPAANLLLTGIFLFCLATLAAGALLAVFSKRLIRSVCGLAVCCFGLAGLYYFLHSPFLAMMEILVYVGAVCVTIVFAIMLAEPEEPSDAETSGASMMWASAALGVSLAVFCSLAWLGSQTKWTYPVRLDNDGSIAAIGIALLTTYSLPFELISLALLVAILGALVLARTGRSLPSETNIPVANGEPKRPGTNGARRRVDGTSSDESLELPDVVTTASAPHGSHAHRAAEASQPREESQPV